MKDLRGTEHNINISFMFCQEFPRILQRLFEWNVCPLTLLGEPAFLVFWGIFSLPMLLEITRITALKYCSNQLSKCKSGQLKTSLVIWFPVTGNATVRQYSSMIYGCPLGTKLVILSASFGLPPSCPYIDVLLKVKSLCKNKVRRCSIYASPNEFPNSCSGRKQLKTTYRCDAGAYSHRRFSPSLLLFL